MAKYTLVRNKLNTIVKHFRGSTQEYTIILLDSDNTDLEVTTGYDVVIRVKDNITDPAATATFTGTQHPINDNWYVFTIENIDSAGDYFADIAIIEGVTGGTVDVITAFTIQVLPVVE